MSFQVKLHGVEKVAPELQSAAHAGILRGLEAVGIRGSVLVQNNIKTPYNGRPAAVASGQLVNSIHGDIIQGDNVNRVVIAAHPPADVYAAPVETGTAPHFPPPQALVPWVKLKFKVGDKEALSIAFAIAKRISQRGTKGQFMFQRALEQLSGEAASIMERSLAESFAAAGYKGAA